MRQAEDAGGGAQVYTVAEGRCRVCGYGVELLTSRRLSYAATPDLRFIDTEVIEADGSGKQRINVAHPPIHNITALRVTLQKTVSVVHGSYSGCADALPDTSVMSLVEIKQGDTTYEAGTDYKRTGDTVDWSPTGNEPATGSTYQATYTYLDKTLTPEEPDYFAGGDGSVGDPYQIATEAQLRAFAEATQAGKLVTTNVCFVLTADIALNGEWTPVHSFGGTFDGGDHTVSGMTIGTADAPSKLVSAGFFDVLANTARVHDLHLTNASVYVQRSGAALDDRIYAGGLVGGAGTAGSNVRIDNCSVTGSTISAASGTFAYAGGLAGRLDRENVVTNCWTDIAVTAVSANSPACAGGLVATIGGSSMIANAAALGDVSVTGVSAEYNWCRAGGLLGSSAYLTHNCYASGNVSLQDSAESGRLRPLFQWRSPALQRRDADGQGDRLHPRLVVF